jgi:dTMP kinase
VNESDLKMKGAFITFEGVDGSGKSTQVSTLDGALQTRGLGVVATREPGGSPVAERIRRILLDPEAGEMAWATEVMLYLASRAEHVAEVVRPALEKGKVVLCDRFLDSTLAYQAYGRRVNGSDLGIALSAIRRANELGTGGIAPELTFLLDVDPEEGLERVRDSGRSPDRLEGGGTAFLHRVRNGFLALADSEPGRFVVIDGTRTVKEIAQEIEVITCELLSKKGML